MTNYKLDQSERLSYAASLVLVAEALHSEEAYLWEPAEALAKRAVDLELIRMELAGIDEQIMEVLELASKPSEKGAKPEEARRYE